MAPRILQHNILDCTVSSTLPLESAKAIKSFMWHWLSEGRSADKVSIHADSSWNKKRRMGQIQLQIILSKPNILPDYKWNAYIQVTLYLCGFFSINIRHDNWLYPFDNFLLPQEPFFSNGSHCRRHRYLQHTETEFWLEILQYAWFLCIQCEAPRNEGEVQIINGRCI